MTAFFAILGLAVVERLLHFMFYISQNSCKTVNMRRTRQIPRHVEVDECIPVPRRRRRKLAKKRNRNLCGATANKWSNYRKTLNRHLLNLTRDEHFCNTLSIQRSRDSIVLLGELQHYGEKIKISKCAIVSLFEELAAENSNDQRHSTLSIPDENGMVDLESINCSKCNGKDTEGNDILFCDREGCYRAYHQSCLSPPLLTDQMNFDDPDEDWFCWQCECLDDCLDMVNDMCNTDVTCVDGLFPELREGSGTDNVARSTAEDEEEDEEDEDYDSQGDNSDSNNEVDLNDEDEGSGDNGDDVTGKSDTNYDDDDDDDDAEQFVEDQLLSIDNDELRYLMAEAGAEATDTHTTGRRLRTRQPKSAASHEHVKPENVRPNQPVARIKQGYVDVGHVVEEQQQGEWGEEEEEGGGRRWLVVFGVDECHMAWSELRRCLLEYAQYEQDLRRIQSAVQAAVSSSQAPYDECNPANIVTGKRRTKKVDYRMLNEAMFGDETAATLTFLDDSKDSDYRVSRRRAPAVTSPSEYSPSLKRKTHRAAEESSEELGGEGLAASAAEKGGGRRAKKVARKLRTGER